MFEKGISFVATVALMTVGCSTMAPKNFEDFHHGTWEAKVLIQDKKKNKSQIIHLDIAAIRPEQMRIDAATPLGIQLAVVTVNGDRVQYILPRQKQFHQGRLAEKNANAVLDLPFAWADLMGLLFEDSSLGSRWKCERDPQGWYKQCVQGASIMEWLDRNGDSRTIKITKNSTQLQILLSQFQSKVEMPMDRFTLSAPPGFKVIQ